MQNRLKANVLKHRATNAVTKQRIRKPGYDKPSPGYRRFGFHAEERLIDQLKKYCQTNNKLIMDVMNDAIREFLRHN